MRRFFKEFFSFTRSELRIIAVLSVLITLTMFLRMLLPHTLISDFKLSAEDQAAIDSFIRSLEKIEYENVQEYTIREDEVQQPEYRLFDPNEITLAELDEMRFPHFIGKNLINYRKAGGRINNKSDFNKLYGMSDSIFSEWEPYLIIQEPAEKEFANVALTVQPLLEINSADSVDLLDVHGIGPYYAGKIISYRNRLGGFLSTEQIMEIRGMDSTKYFNIVNQISADTLKISKIDLNSVSLTELKKHPYISARSAEAVLKYRNFADSIKDINEILENNIVPETEFEKLKPYISVGK